MYHIITAQFYGPRLESEFCALPFPLLEVADDRGSSERKSKTDEDTIENISVG